MDAIVSHTGFGAFQVYNSSILCHNKPSYLAALKYDFTGARDRDRTGDLSLTKEVLCQLSYAGKESYVFVQLPRCVFKMPAKI